MILKTSSADFLTGLVFGFDVGTGSIGEAVRLDNKFLHKASLRIPAEFAENKKGLRLAPAPVQELRLMASLLSSRQFGILATAGFDLGAMENLFN